MAFDGPYAAPATAEAYERWLNRGVAWGVETFEHDWLVEVFFGVRGLRERAGPGPGLAGGHRPGRPRAGASPCSGAWGTPADFAQTTTLTQVTSVRTCGDHGYIATPGQLWAWFCTTNALARGPRPHAVQGRLRADPEVAGTNGEPEALLSALSTEPVGLGDAVGRFDPTLALRTCRADGRLIKPHVPIAGATGRSMLANTGFHDELMVAECYSNHPAGRWAYVLAVHANPSDQVVTGAVEGWPTWARARPTGDVVAWDWRAGAATRLGADRAPGRGRVASEEWTYLGLAPGARASGLAVIGDTTKFVTAGDAQLRGRVDSDGGVRAAW